MTDDLAFDWDNANIDHIACHHVTPQEVEQLFTNKAVDIDFDVVNGEQRWTSIGHTEQLRILRTNSLPTSIWQREDCDGHGE